MRSPGLATRRGAMGWVKATFEVAYFAGTGLLIWRQTTPAATTRHSTTAPSEHRIQCRRTNPLRRSGAGVISAGRGSFLATGKTPSTLHDLCNLLGVRLPMHGAL